MTPREKLKITNLLDDLLTADAFEAAKKAKELRRVYNELRAKPKSDPCRAEKKRQEHQEQAV